MWQLYCDTDVDSHRKGCKAYSFLSTKLPKLDVQSCIVELNGILFITFYCHAKYSNITTANISTYYQAYSQPSTVQLNWLSLLPRRPLANQKATAQSRGTTRWKGRPRDLSPKKNLKTQLLIAPSTGMQAAAPRIRTELCSTTPFTYPTNL